MEFTIKEQINYARHLEIKREVKGLPDMSKVRSFLEAIRIMAVHLNEEEMSEIGQMLLAASERLEREGKVE